MLQSPWSSRSRHGEPASSLRGAADAKGPSGLLGCGPRLSGNFVPGRELSPAQMWADLLHPWKALDWGVVSSSEGSRWIISQLLPAHTRQTTMHAAGNILEALPLQPQERRTESRRHQWEESQSRGSEADFSAQLCPSTALLHGINLSAPPHPTIKGHPG